MKYILSFFAVCAIGIIFLLCGVVNNASFGLQPQEFLRIHIRANSNSSQDQEVKYKVKDAVVDALIPLLKDCQSKNEAMQMIKNNFAFIENVANEVLCKNNFSYSSNAKLTNEYFPTRVYDNLTLPEGNYDALILNLGNGEGNNWWCVVFPAFCFTQTKNPDNIVYISQIWDIIKNILRW